MDKIKILAIAPYSGLKALISEIASDREELEVHTYVADMLDGVEVVKSIQDKKFDAIISRAGTAELIRKVTELPVIDIKLSYIDMMRAIGLAQNYSGKFVIAGYKSITDIAKVICQLMQYEIEIKTISDISQIDHCLTELKETGVNLIVGDVITINHAKMLGLNTVLVTSGRESVLSSFDEVVNIHSLLKKSQSNNLLIRNILEKSKGSVICFTIDRKIIYSNIKEDAEDSQNILTEIEGLIKILIKENELNIIKKVGNNVIKIKGEVQEYRGSLYLTFYYESLVTPIKPFCHAITYNNISDAPKMNFDTFFTASDLFKNVIKHAKAYSTTQTPIIIFGDRGTGKDTIAKAIYHNSEYKKNPLMIIDAKYMNEKKWVSIFESEGSSFVDSHLTIYIKNLHMMDESSQKIFESYFANTYVHKRNRFIFSCINGYSKAFDNSPLLFFLRNELNALPLLLPSLTQRKEDIPSLASLLLSDLNIKYGKQVMGLDDAALALLQEFNWENNISQFKRVMEELVILTTEFYINEENVRSVLSSENITNTCSYKHFLDLNKSLDEINKDIIDLVLTEEDFNQSKAAERLGISRSTLWRKIK